MRIPQSWPRKELLACRLRCRKEKRALLTLDADFSDIRRYSPRDFNGLIVLRLKKQDKTYVRSVVKRRIKLLSKEPLERHWTYPRIVDSFRLSILGDTENILSYSNGETWPRDE